MREAGGGKAGTGGARRRRADGRSSGERRATGPSRPEAGGPWVRRETFVRRCRSAHLEELLAAPSRRRDPPLEAVAAREGLGSLLRRPAPRGT